jgi:hypothetical protein
LKRWESFLALNRYFSGIKIKIACIDTKLVAPTTRNRPQLNVLINIDKPLNNIGSELKVMILGEDVPRATRHILTGLGLPNHLY